MEKRRRARINDSLGQLKTLVLQAMKKDVSKSQVYLLVKLFNVISLIQMLIFKYV